MSLLERSLAQKGGSGASRRHRRARQQAQTRRRAAPHHQRARRAPRLMHGGRGTSQLGQARLKRYVAKRDFKKTAEPSHKARAPQSGKKLIFVVQKHAARRLHWDFRLEWEGTLRSWAVPKGPSLDPARQAARGRSRRPSRSPTPSSRATSRRASTAAATSTSGTTAPGSRSAISTKGLKKGHLEFEMFGKKLHGRWHLVRTRMQGKQPNWLLMKSDDFAARAGADADVIDAGGADEPKRMLQRRTRGETRVHAQSRSAVARQSRAAPSRAARAASALPATHQAAARHARRQGARRRRLGLRAQVRRRPAAVPLRRRRRALHLAQRHRLDAQGGAGRRGAGEAETRRRLGRWRAHRHRPERPLRFLAAAAHDGTEAGSTSCSSASSTCSTTRGEDLRDLPLSRAQDAARCRVRQTTGQRGRCASPTRSTATARELLARVCNQHLEGLVAKKIDSPYRGDRSENWLKVKCHREQEFVVGGAAFLPGRGTGTFSSLLVGVKSGKGLKYVGRVGGGFDANERAEWHERSKKLAQKDSPFDNHPDKRSGEIWHWMKPQLVIQVAFADWTHSGILRQPRYLGLRAGSRSEDRGARRTGAHRGRREGSESPRRKAQGEGNGEKSRAAKAATRRAAASGSRIPIACCSRTTASPSCSSPSTSRRSARRAMPHYQRPAAVASCATRMARSHSSRSTSSRSRAPACAIVQIPNADKDPDFVVCDSPEGLLHLAQVGAVELHSWGAVMPKPKQADRLTFDLDPGADLPYRTAARRGARDPQAHAGPRARVAG